MGKIAFIRLLNTCNCKCQMCSVWKRNPEEFELDKLTNILETLKSKGYDKIVFTGGEPTIYSRFDELNKFIKEKGFSFGLISNGSVIKDRWQSLFSFKEPDFIIFSLDSFESEYHDNNRGILGLHKKVVEAIDFTLTKGVDVVINTVITKNNFLELEKFSKFTFFKDLTEWQWMPVKFAPEIALGEKEWIEIKKIYDFYLNRNNTFIPNIISTFDFKENTKNFSNLINEKFTQDYYLKNDCNICKKQIFIDIDGSVYRCNSFDTRMGDKVCFGNFNKNSIEELITKAELKEVFEKPGCVNCDPRNQRYNQKGIWIETWKN